ncbi:MAG TPA: carbon monoxide dehydrogenase subunit G [Vicinamibacterales bacterium]|nr:carbon monoxide dehydrogenase subunit G [Vicinamibacterales bacterium]
MDVTGSYTFAASPDAVWKALTDPVVIAACLPGCDRLEPLGEDKYSAAMTLAVAAVTGNYTGTVSMLDKNPPHSYRLVVEGSGKPGFVNGEATIELIAEGSGTIVRVTGQGNVGGVIARVGQRLLGSVSKMMMDRFFACLQERI